MGRALAARLVEAGLAVVVGSSTRDTKGYNLPCPVESIAEAVEEAHVVFLAVPDYAHLLVMNAADFSNRVVVDVSNRRERRSYGKSIAECLRDAWSEHHQRCVVVKAFNTVSAYHLQWHARGRSVFIAGDSAAAKAQQSMQVASLAESMGFTTADVGGLMSARKLEDIPHRLFPRWGVAGLMALVTFAAWLVYNILWYHVWSYGSANPFLPDEPLFSYQQLPAKTINGAVAMSAASLLSLVFLATAVARVWQMCRRDFDAAFPRWLAGWLACRKEIGLLGALLACVHVVISLALLDPWYYPSLYRFVGLVQSSAGRPLGPASLANRPLLTKWGESFVLSGSVALLLLALAAACSIPSVAAGLSWREADLVLSKS
ncbi:unnamed protein product [Pedinophyceae sp. YPF-701]|nr:unnamed protein product [Pedinophyceae sp. YPF-701]